jgi:restriction endonuclease S subunit
MKRLWRFASGTTHQTIYYPEAKAFHVCLPPLAEQKAIAAVLGALDDKIELNRRMNATLEAMARALFQSWFVDFDPVRAKLEGRPPAALDPATAALFPDSFQDSPLGPIPQGWSLVRSDDRFETLVASLDVGVVRPRSRCVSVPFLYGLFMTSEFQAHTYSYTTGTTVLHLSAAAIPSYVFAVPVSHISEVYSERVSPIFRKIDENTKQSRTLATLRDTLLPKLLSGELSVAALKESMP